MLFSRYEFDFNTGHVIAAFPSLKMSELIMACFFCGNSFNLTQSSLGSDDNHLVFDSLRDHAMITGGLSNFIIDLSLVDLLPKAFFIKIQFFCKSIQFIFRTF